jgi:hypothetical protein
MQHLFTKYLPIVYQNKAADLQIWDIASQAIATVTEVMFVNMWREMEYRFDACQATNDAYIEL